jgi:hypothetical protein
LFVWGDLAAAWRYKADNYVKPAKFPWMRRVGDQAPDYCNPTPDRGR